MKKCSKCFLQKDLNTFSKKGTKKDGSVRYESQCKKCKAKKDSLRYRKKQVLKKEKPIKASISNYHFKIIKAKGSSLSLPEVIELCMQKLKEK